MRRSRQHNLAAAGFTFAELVIGMAITTLVMGALMSFTMAVGAAWKANEHEEAACIIANVATARVGHIVRKTRLPGAFYEGAIDGTAPNEAAVILWVTDSNEDEVIQLSELEVLAFDKATKSVVRYQPTNLQTDANLTPEEFYNVATIGLLKTMFDRAPVVGKIDGARVYRVDASTARPALELILRIVQGGRENNLSVSLSCRGAAAAPAVAAN